MHNVRRTLSVKIVSGETRSYKVVLPIVWFGFLALFLVIGLLVGEPFLIAFALGMSVILFFILRKLVWDLVDEVWDAGDHLVVRMRGKEHRVGLEEIVRIHAHGGFRVTITLRSSGPLGEEWTFHPPQLFGPPPIVADLAKRADQARRSRRGSSSPGHAV